MLQHLRFHRRNTSNPTSPLPDQLSTWEATALHEHPQTTQDVSPRPEIRPRSSNSVQLPPMLPPIARVTSADSELSFEPHESPRPMSQDSRTTASTRSAYDGSNAAFVGGAALPNRRWDTQDMLQQRPDSAGSLPNTVPVTLISRSKPPPPPINTGYASGPVPTLNKQARQPFSFVTPTDLQQSSTMAPGKRPGGARMTSEPVPLVATTSGPETQKAKRSRPFLKNPVTSLLMRRKTGQNAADVAADVQPSYDPRIRGTRVHDFSAPRPNRMYSSMDGTATSPTSAYPTSDPSRPQCVGEQAADHQPQQPTRFNPSIVVDRAQEGSTAREPELASPEAQQFSVRKPSSDQQTPPVPQKDSSPDSPPTSSMTSRALSVNTTIVRNATSSSKAPRNKNLSLSRASTKGSVMSSVPKYMKSTSSRFSFDMMGSASEEKLLEERHRQREQEKKTGEAEESTHPRDSRFDDFDEDFDYDAMMEDDGLEERIPGVNADLEEEDGFEVSVDPVNDALEDKDGFEDAVDPDNDQENFAGFVFQRSNPSSSLASPNTPGMLATPRDANGKVIGFAMTKDTTPDMPSTASPIYLPDMTFPSKQEGDAPGLGIHGLIISQESPHDEMPVQPDFQPPSVDLSVPRTTNADDIYFDDGLADELDFEHDGTVFDESIFDNLDTDKYGRPIPGAFARAHEAMRAAQKQQPAKRDSDEVTSSRLSAQSGASQSTAPTSLSAGLQHIPTKDIVGPDAILSVEEPQAEEQQNATISDPDLAYQAALAEAAQKAAASGKFRRSSSPPLPAELTITSPTDSSESLKYSQPDVSLDDYEAEDPSYDDFDFDDEAIIAEANASALANDSDGWYGQEFGFYSAPLQPAHSVHHGHARDNSTSSNGSSANVPLSAENLFQYANGGYFGPAGQGLLRSASGRVLREPNLTPITERSEYSNRNSVMSLALPPAFGTEGGGRNSSGGLPSPGLAQLALLSSSEDDTMTLGALMKLRSKKWGGSQGSGVSSREGSPRSERPAVLAPGGDSSPFGGPLVGAGMQQYAGTPHARKNSAFSVWSNNSDGGALPGESGSGSPTVTMAQLPSSPAAQMPPSMVPLQQQQLFASPLLPQLQGAPSPGLTNVISPVLEGKEMGFDDRKDGAQLAMAQHQGMLPSNPLNMFPFPVGPTTNPLYPQWANSPIQAQMARLTMNHNSHQQRPVSRERSPSLPGSVGTAAVVPPMPVPVPGTSPVPVSAAAAATGTSSRPTSPLARRPMSGHGHRHKGSADSISYVKDESSAGAEDGDGGRGGGDGTRWVLERRRTAENGEVEILERGVIKGGRI
ncbi:hypothetical protein B0H66DRAFT_565557 [Apodospora peruviana]|uniref:Uncharacterized protein n=1 Tax=Apodospora peruviana TaxID=516989 RepID=A0AAE0HZJ6_9PEZI|nr:hypothetical protein B0H66DRAFT_565557 [Apodospora peruviana]